MTSARPAPTRLRILIEASRLFAIRGYHGTSTRDIAGAVGIQQPSLYKHFATKHEILAALLDEDLGPALARIRAAVAADGQVAVRLHAFVVGDIAAVLSLPYDVRGLYNDDVLQLPELAAQARSRARLHAATADLVRLGVEAGEFVAEEPEFVQGAITGLLLEVVREQGPEPAADPRTPATRVADFVLRSVLADPRRMPEVRAASATLAARIERAG
ncbi:TetR/AcrR family transcriptional regulator [Calidifontibacter sp. DB0510]|uniref:TetR/AcrR family transcriptional regulator n=1 Tax=Metallococcus carri TaxID=1656884 RepID=A0A967B0C9_9MICO|nr:TetR/AcrR family transcriptional regulator [Metallococcus carri]NHN56459.1 TetR/AcrR family transcriptional regulator [Metallococcus carri]NOP36083.1 TetR/AcrR family transcriptional regulator [Calidifontibacter sp. DB2511S]